MRREFFFEELTENGVIHMSLAMDALVRVREEHEPGNYRTAFKTAHGPSHESPGAAGELEPAIYFRHGQ